MTKTPDRLLRSHVVAYLLGFRNTPDRPTFGARAKNAIERVDESAMGCFRTAIAEGRVPAPDKYIGRIPHWRESTVNAFIDSGDTAPRALRPGEGELTRTLRAKRGRPALAKREAANV